MMNDGTGSATSSDPGLQILGGLLNLGGQALNQLATPKAPPPNPAPDVARAPTTPQGVMDAIPTWGWIAGAVVVGGLVIWAVAK